MPTVPFQSYIRLAHTGVLADGRANTNSILIKDLDVGYEYQNRKSPVYIPVGGFIDVPLSTRAIFSVMQGEIAQLAALGLITVAASSYTRDSSDLGGAAGLGINLNALVATNVRRDTNVLSFVITAGTDTNGFLVGERMTVVGLAGAFAGLNGTYLITVFTKGQDFAGVNPAAAIVSVASVGADIPAALVAGVTLTLPDGVTTHLFVSEGNAGGLGADIRAYIAGDLVVTGAVDPTRVQFSPIDMSTAPENSIGVDSASGILKFVDPTGTVIPLSVSGDAFDEVFTVAKSGGQFTTIEQGLNAASLVATSTYRVVVVIYPGDYYENNPLTVPSYTAISCPGGSRTTRVFCNEPNANGLVLSTYSEIFGLQVQGASGAGYAAFYWPPTTRSSKLDSCRYRDCDIGFHSQASMPDPAIFNYYPACWEGTASVGYQCSLGGRQLILGAVNTGGSTVGTWLKSDGAGTRLTMYMARCSGANVTRFLEVSNTATLELQVCHTDFVDEGAFVLGTGGLLQMSSVQITQCIGAHLNLADSALVTCTLLNCYMDDDTFVIGPSATLTGSYESTGTKPGPTIIGELWLGTDPAEQVPLSTYIRDTASTGWDNGGLVTRAGGFNLDVTSGAGLVSTGTGVVQVDWSAATVTAPAVNSEFWVYVTPTAVVSIAVGEPSYETNIILASGYADGVGIAVLSAHKVPLPQIIERRHQYITQVIGPIWLSGMTTTSPGGLALDVDSGRFYHNEVEETTTGTTPITFTYWYQNGAGGWTTVSGQVALDDGFYDDGSGVLAAIPAGEWKKDQLYISQSDTTTEYHILYAQSTHAAQVDAETTTLSTAPSFFEIDVMPLYSPVLQQGAGVIASLLDERPRIVAVGPGTAAAPVSHGALAGLGKDDHSQYLLLNGNAARNPVTGAVNFAGGTLVLPTAAVPVQTAEGSVVWDSDDDLLTVGDGVARKTMVDTNTAQTLENKTLSAPTIGDASNIVAAAVGTPGVLELATQPEVDAGVDNTKAVTPLTLNAWPGGGGGITEYAVFQDQKASGTAGGTFTSGAWQTRTLNTSVILVGAGISRAGNVITLANGTYEVEAVAQASRVAGHKARFRNTTDNTTVVVGDSCYSHAAAQAQDQAGATVVGIFTVAGGPKNFELQHWCATTQATSGYGVPVTSGEAEVYATVKILKLA